MTQIFNFKYNRQRQLVDMVERKRTSRSTNRKKSPEAEARAKRAERTEPKMKFLVEEAKVEPDEQPASKIPTEVEGKKGSDVAEKTFTMDPRLRWCSKIIAMRPADICREFVSNKNYKPDKYTMVNWEKNEAKNRYDDIFCMDATRVILKDRKGDDDYINASWIDCLPDGQKYICTQGPVTSTIPDFWHMIFTEKSTVIVMLTALEDDGKCSKCSLYYPTSKSDPLISGSYKISLKSNEKEPFPTMKYNILQVEKFGQTLDVHHFIYDTWPDHTAPESPIPCVGLFKQVKKIAGGQPITVHCSAGIGRTATFVGIDYASQKIIQHGEMWSMVDVIKDLRQKRIQAIQSFTQYLFLHVCLLEYFFQEGALVKDQKFENFYGLCVKKLKIRTLKKKKPE